LKGKRKLLNIFYIFLFSSFQLFSQNYNIDFYGIISEDIDNNMAKMTGDLYYTQLSEINSFSVTDKRTGNLLTEYPETENFANSKIAFYISIKKDTKTDKWSTTYHVYDKNSESEKTKTNQYDSFYKILMESKNTLQANLKNIIESDTFEVHSSSKEIAAAPDKTEKSIINSTESLSGNWAGEENIAKIVILRGGRGFIIFKNGASMNVSVSITNPELSEITITQTGKSNASFYPELQRNTALTAALSAEPIKWTLFVKDNSTLIGKKQTLLPDGDSYTSGNIDVEWKKLN